MTNANQNPAGRLADALKSITPYYQPDRAERAVTREVLATVLQISDKNDTAAIYVGITRLLNQLDDAERIIREKSDIDQDLYLTSFPAIRAGLTPTGLDGAWSNQSRHLTPVALRDLQFCASKIAEFYSEGELSTEELSDIAKSLEALFTAIEKAAIDDELRRTLLDQLEKIRHALAEYRIRGPKGLRDALAGSLGTAMLLRDQATSSEESRSTFQKLVAFLSKFDQILGRAMKYKTLLEPLTVKLLLGSDG